MDGLTGAVQERMIAESKTKSGHMMFNMNLFSIGYLAIGRLLKPLPGYASKVVLEL